MTSYFSAKIKAATVRQVDVDNYQGGLLVLKQIETGVY